MKDWKYGDAGDRYPVQPGEMWQVGGHRFLCADLEALKAPVYTAQPDVVYVDPPWNASAAKSYRTKAGLRSDEKVDFYDLFIPAMIRQIRHCKGSVFCETGIKSARRLSEVFVAHGARELNRWDIRYFKK